LALLAAALVVALVPAPAQAGKWPQPAAGPSASGDPEILFTFDDGPHEDATGPILDLLERHHIRAVFFWTGWRVRSRRPVGDVRRALVARALAEGHVIGNHTVNHAHLCAIPAADALKEIDDNARVYEQLTGMVTVFFRSPYGGRCQRLEQWLAERGIAHFHWDLDASEWQSYSSDQTRDYLVERIGKLADGKRAVILLHDTKWPSVKALAQLLDWIERENARRALVGRRAIRIIDYGDVVLERIPAPVRAFVDRTALDTAGFVPTILGRLVDPLAPGTAPQARLAPGPAPL
jgi:peptidoglycan/xylan/chitin deacetylase (PgdA/CDA1 family)